MHHKIDNIRYSTWILAAIWLTAGVAVAAPWPVFHGDAQHTGYSPNDAPFDSLLAWSYQAGDSIVTSSPVVGEDGTIYIGTLGDDLLALSFSGDLLWSFHAGGNFRHSTPAIGPGGEIYIGGADGVLNAVDPAGDLLWSFTMGSPIKTGINLAADGTIYFGADDGYLYALDPAGNLEWRYSTRGMIRSSPAIGPDGTIFFGSMDKYFYALWPDGTLRWRALTGDIIKYCSPAVADDGTVYFGSYDGFLYAVGSDMTFHWAYPTGNVIRSSPCIGPQGRIFMGSGDELLAINPDGELDWSYSTGGVIYSAPVYFGDDDVIVVGSDDGIVYCLHDDGSLDWTFTVGNPVRSSPAPGLMGTILLADITGKIWCLGDLEGVGVAESWPGTPSGWGVRPSPGIAPLTFFALGGRQSTASIEIFDVQGRKVRSIHPGGAGSIAWDGKDDQGRSIPAGVYLYRAGEIAHPGRFVLIR